MCFYTVVWINFAPAPSGRSGRSLALMLQGIIFCFFTVFATPFFSSRVATKGRHNLDWQRGNTPRPWIIFFFRLHECARSSNERSGACVEMETGTGERRSCGSIRVSHIPASRIAISRTEHWKTREKRECFAVVVFVLKTRGNNSSSCNPFPSWSCVL